MYHGCLRRALFGACALFGAGSTTLGLETYGIKPANIVLIVGTAIVIDGLTTAEWNGCQGLIAGYDERFNRYSVAIKGRDKRLGLQLDRCVVESLSQQILASANTPSVAVFAGSLGTASSTPLETAVLAICAEIPGIGVKKLVKELHRLHPGEFDGVKTKEIRETVRDLQASKEKTAVARDLADEIIVSREAILSDTPDNLMTVDGHNPLKDNWHPSDGVPFPYIRLALDGESAKETKSRQDEELRAFEHNLDMTLRQSGADEKVRTLIKMLNRLGHASTEAAAAAGGQSDADDEPAPS